MPRKQKIWGWTFFALFVISEVLWGSIWGVVSETLSLPGPRFAEAQIFADNWPLIYLTIIFEIFLWVKIIIINSRYIGEEKWRFLIIIPGGLIILYLLFILWLYHGLRHGIGF